MASIPVESTSMTIGSQKQAGLPGLNFILLILLAVTILPLPGGGHAIHSVGGIFLLIACGVHLARHGRWIKAVILETPKNVSPGLRRQRGLFRGLLLSGLLCGLSGLVALLFIHNPPAFLLMLCCGSPIHILSGLVFLGLNIYHLVLHRNWFGKKMAISPRRPG